MDIYLVGGAIRDQLLGLPVHERDWVVVGATPEMMLAQGFSQVGRDFPVFLHPETHEEYALARTERKSGKGYGGFTVHAAPDVSLEADLKRRDLTINAIAQDQHGRIIDPYGGQADLANGCLRHISPAFIEDPLRILRIARFAARFAQQDFQIANETATLMRQMIQSGELTDLVPERVWQELHKVFQLEKPSIFFNMLHEYGALSAILPEIDALYGVPNPPKWHPEIDSGIHTQLVLDQAAMLSDDPKVVFAALLHDVGKALTPQALWPAHPDHEVKGTALAQQICQRLRVPKAYRKLALLVCQYHGHCHRIFELSPQEILTLLNRLDPWRSYDRFCQFLTACRADAQGCLGFETRPYPQADRLKQLWQAANTVQARDLMAQGLAGIDVVNALKAGRLAAITAFCTDNPSHH